MSVEVRGWGGASGDGVGASSHELIVALLIEAAGCCAWLSRCEHKKRERRRERRRERDAWSPSRRADRSANQKRREGEVGRACRSCTALPWAVRGASDAHGAAVAARANGEAPPCAP